MSDDTPTQRFPEPGDNPTERISTGEVQEDLQEEKQKSRGLLIGLIIAGVLLLIAIIVLLVFLFGPKGEGDPVAVDTASPSPSASATPDALPSPTPTLTAEPTEEPVDPPANPPQQPSGPVINSFSTGTGTVTCDNGNGEDIDLYITWSTSGGSRVYFGVDTNDASTAPFFDNLPLSGNSGSNFPSGYSPFNFSCGPDTASHKYTLTVVDGQGNKQSKSVTVKDLTYAQNH